MFLRRTSVGCLRAFLDGYSLAAVEEGFRTCVDLEGFEYWVRERFCLRGLFRWEDAILTQLGGDEATAFQWAVRRARAAQLATQAFRAEDAQQIEAGLSSLIKRLESGATTEEIVEALRQLAFERITMNADPARILRVTV